MSNTPKLRFKEFSGDWEENTLKNISTHIKRTSGEVIENILTISAGRGFLEQKDRFSQVIAGNSLSKYTLLYENEFSYNRGNSKKYTYGCIYRLKDFQQALVPNVYISFKLNNQIEGFYEQLFAKKYLDRQLRQLISSSARMDGLLNINKSEFFKIKVPVPSLEEQEKIASFFSLIDDKISLQGEKVEALKDYKKGMMQKIFSKELRFKDDNGKDYPEWEEKKLGDIAECLDNKRKALNSTEREEIQGDIPYYGANGVVDFINDYTFNEDIILLAEDGGNFDNFVTRPIAQFVTGKSWVNNHAHVLRAKYNTEFLFYSLVHKDIRKYINGTSRSKLNKSDMLDILINIPKSLEEQKKIADVFGAIYLKIEKDQEKLDSLNEYKKGLLQQMFV